MEHAEKTKRCPMWVKLLLGVSLALNLAVVGLVAGMVLRGGPLGGKGPVAMGYATPYVIALPRDLRRGVFNGIRRDKTLPDRKARRADYQAMVAVLRATPLDTAAVEDLLRKQADAVTRVQARGQTAWLEAVAGMSDIERAAYADRIEEVLRRGGHRKKGGQPKD
ncbi:periplasmic heavy metal sensor [uncultured Tateyamaria sp.]|uniref:periplasmic heavy metal sensor n=1 Tax=uncultured Tateyamaria sp. TaxID=455651 RepID=UPI00261C3F32|nr:periplasmic heavy metal sensor [uncultured Tateyamaria sp.]